MKKHQPYVYTMPEKFMDDSSVPLKWRLYGIINGFWVNQKTVFATNEWFMSRLKAPERTIQAALSDLEKEKLLSRQTVKNKRVILPYLGEGAAPLHPPMQPDCTHTINAISTNKEFSKENSSLQVTESKADTDGDSLGTKPNKYIPKKPTDSPTWRVVRYFNAGVEREFDRKLDVNTKYLGVAKNALQRISEKQAKEMIDEWFRDAQVSNDDLMQITRCLSGRRIDEFLYE